MRCTVSIRNPAMHMMQGTTLYHLTVHKHLDQDPLIQFREAFRWVDRQGPGSSPMRDAAMGVSPSLWRAKHRLSQSMVIL